MPKQVDPSHYGFLRYIDKARFISFYHQLRLIHELAPTSLLEIGPGPNILRRLIGTEIRYLAVDADEELSPDVVAGLPSLPFSSESFQMAVCFQVLEHLPFDQFELCLKELARVSRDHVLISLPYARYRFQIAVNFPRIKWRYLTLTIPHCFRTHRFNGEHYWVVGSRGYSLRRIRTLVRKYFTIVNVFSPFEKQEHVFLTLKKIKRPESHAALWSN
jgi:hypothetical protein